MCVSPVTLSFQTNLLRVPRPQCSRRQLRLSTWFRSSIVTCWLCVTPEGDVTPVGFCLYLHVTVLFSQGSALANPEAKNTQTHISGHEEPCSGDGSWHSRLRRHGGHPRPIPEYGCTPLQVLGSPSPTPCHQVGRACPFPREHCRGKGLQDTRPCLAPWQSAAGTLHTQGWETQLHAWNLSTERSQQTL